MNKHIKSFLIFLIITMDDFVISNLHESRNEWCGRLVTLLTPLTIEGIKSIFNESWKMCSDSGEMSKYLMTFQNLLARVPKWNSVILEEERNRIIERSGCNYLEDLITCVHIIQLKVLTCIRVGNKQKKIDISIPKLDHFLHRVYIHVARKVYSNVYLFERNISDLQVQKNLRELEIMVQECILTAIRESIPTESIIRAYLDENQEEEEEEIIEPIPEENETDKKQKDELKNEANLKEDTTTSEPEELKQEELPPVLSVENVNDDKVVTKLSFNDVDAASDGTSINAPKTVERLEQISEERNIQRKLEEEEEEEQDRVNIHMDDDVVLDDVFDLDKTGMDMKEDNISLDVEEL